MRYKHLTNANVDISVLGIGTWAIGGDGYGEVNEADSIAAIRKALDEGANLIDTAPAYGSGYAETVVGKAIKGYDRSKLFISTKYGIGRTSLHSKKFPGTFSRDASFENILYECEQSLRRLGTDYIDFYFMHWPDTETPLEETCKALQLLKDEGKIRFIGVSNFDQDRITEMSKYIKIDVIQPPYSMVVLRDVELMKWCTEQGIDSLSYGSLGAGILTGKFREVPTFGPRDPRNGFYPYFKEPHFSKVMKLLAVMDEIAAETGKPLAQIALNYTVQQDYIACALCGMTNEHQADQNAHSFDWELNTEQLAKLDKAIETYIDFDGSQAAR